MPRRVALSVVAAASLVLAALSPLGAQQVVAQQAPPPLATAERARVVAMSARAIDSLYVERTIAQRMSSFLRDGARTGRWDQLTSPTVFADSLTAQLRAISHDQHVHLFFDPRDPRLVEGVTPEERKRRYDDVVQEIADANFGVPEVRILEGNVALLRMDNFNDPRLAATTLAAAMTMVQRSRALVIDLRKNGGGHSDQFVLMMSYFLEKPVKIGESFTRPDSTLEQTWTYAVVPGPRYAPNKPVYVLTSHRTFSAAEALAGALRRFRHATIVGDTTRGGGHTGDFQPVGERFTLFVPSGASTGHDDVEGQGLRPDVPIPADRALETAHRLALHSITQAIADTSWRRKFERIQRDVDGAAAGVTVSEED